MLLRIPTCCLPALLSTLLTTSGPGGQLLVLAGSLKPYHVVPRDDSDDSDSDDDDDKSSTHHHGSSTSTASGRTSVGSGSSATITGSASKSTTASSLDNGVTSHGAVAGIVIACLLFILLLMCLTCWCRRRRTRARQQAQAAAIAAAAAEMKEQSHSSTPLLVQHPPNPRTRSIAATDAVPGPIYFSDSPGRRETSHDVHNVAPSTDDGGALPNPYDGDTPPQPPPRDLLLISPTSSTSPTGPTTWAYSTAPGDASTSSRGSVSRRESAAPSAWTHDELHSDTASASSAAPLLARGDTQTSRLTASSTLHEEMAGYQKRLEAHHRKESEDAIMREHGIGVGSSVPADPPPVYSAAVEM